MLAVDIPLLFFCFFPGSNPVFWFPISLQDYSYISPFSKWFAEGAGYDAYSSIIRAVSLKNA